MQYCVTGKDEEKLMDVKTPLQYRKQENWVVEHVYSPIFVYIKDAQENTWK